MGGEATLGSYLLIVLLIALSAFFSGSEISYASLNAMRMKNAAETGGKTTRLAYEILLAYDSALVTILIGNNLVNIASSSVATVIAVSLMGDEGAAIATAVMTVLILTFGEIIPKIVAVQVAEGFAKAVSIPLRALMIVTKPVVWVFSKMLTLLDRVWVKMGEQGPSVTEDDLETILETVEDEGVIDEERAELLQSALDFGDLQAYEILTPRVDMLSIDIEDDWAEILGTVYESSFSRIPVYEDTIDNIIGILHLNHFFKELVEKPQFDLRGILMPVNYVPRTMALDDVLATMKKRQCHMVIVADEYGGTMGCLTMEDVLEELVGDIWDESDEIEEEVVELAEDAYEVDGGMGIYDFLEEFDIDDRDFDDDNATVSGWAIEMLGDYPEVGASFDYENLTLTVKEMDSRRVARLAVKVNPLPEEEEED
ncbi:MAG: HlyC/CorC family transporter [Clostridiales bacterium]|nr:HlyC/CorC family transporter [Clostridiales bacterium]